jgi:uncharacterized membrane protein SpoIIM required for sporulation
MNEIQFLHENIHTWEEFEKLIGENSTADPDRLFELYITLTDDLAYARTFYPNTHTTRYLNQLTRKAHLAIYKKPPSRGNKVFDFWKIDFPLLIYNGRKEILISFAIFFISILIGIVSHQHDVRFARIIMGDKYINMTLSNIEKGDPLAVYKSMNQTDMFLGITVNNIKVSFLAYLFGIFTSVGTGILLLTNGVMLGTFHAFLAGKGLLLESISTIWIHGTLEIFAIVVAGAAGIVMGNSLLFPGTFPRGTSFKIGATKGLKIITGLLPVFILAGFLEGFITRYTQAPYILKFMIIGFSLLIIVFYFVIYPKKLNDKKNDRPRPNPI